MPGAEAAERRVALAEVGRAVALAPEDREARRVLLGLLTTRPREAPPEVRAAVERDAVESHYRMLPRVAALYLAPWLIALPTLFLVIGVRDVALVFCSLLPWLVGAVEMLVIHRLRRSTLFTQRIFAVVSGLAVAFTSVFYGPAIILPTLAVVIAFGSGIQQSRANQWFTTVAYGLAIVVPTCLSLAGLLPVRYSLVGDGLVMSPGAVALLPWTLHLASCGMNVVVLLAGMRYALRYRDATTELALANHLSAWQLEQLVPDETAGAMSG